MRSRKPHGGFRNCGFVSLIGKVLVPEDFQRSVDDLDTATALDVRVAPLLHPPFGVSIMMIGQIDAWVIDNMAANNRALAVL